LALVAILILNPLVAQARGSGPKLVVAEYRHNFGDIFAGQFMDHVFTIRNDGTAPLMLSDEVGRKPKAAAIRVPSLPVLPRLSNGLLRAPTSLAATSAANNDNRAALVPKTLMSVAATSMEGAGAAPT
jgi:hypothetical protein